MNNEILILSCVSCAIFDNTFLKAIKASPSSPFICTIMSNFNVYTAYSSIENINLVQSAVLEHEYFSRIHNSYPKVYFLIGRLP